MQKVWNLRPCSDHIVAELSKELKISAILARILTCRGITDPKDAKFFLYGDLDSSFDPFLLKDAGKACARIKYAVKNKEKIMLFGDYDVDGVTSIALLKRIMDACRADAITYIPNRIEEGYGLNNQAISFAKEKNVSLIITADCGIDAFKEVEFAGQCGIDVIITDHHEIKGSELPKAYAIVNPHQKDCLYPFKELAGVGVVYKLMQALTMNTGYNLKRHLDLVALGTVADIVPQRSENRIFTKYGLQTLTNTEKPGLKALIAVSGLTGKQISCTDVGYVLGPRINAMGRIGSADISLKLMLTGSVIEANHLAAILNRENSQRQSIESKILEEAMGMVEREVNFKDQKVIILAKEGWHPGVIGIVASKVQDKFYRPTIMISFNKNIGKGSGRSIEKFHLFDSLCYASDCLIDFGGHETACGLTLDIKDLERFRNKMNEYATKKLTEGELTKVLNIDVDVELSDLNRELLREIEILGPFGPDNPKPIFLSKSAVVSGEPRNIGKNGFKMFVRNGDAVCEAVSFKKDNFIFPRPGQIVDVLYTPSINKWQGVESIQLDLRDMKLAK